MSGLDVQLLVPPLKFAEFSGGARELDWGGRYANDYSRWTSFIRVSVQVMFDIRWQPVVLTDERCCVRLFL
jgi:hypothetical protein